MVHAFIKLNDAAIPAQMPIPREDMMLNSISGSSIFSAIDPNDGFYQILTRPNDTPHTAVSTPSGMLWEWLVMPQGLKNAPANFNRMVLWWSGFSKLRVEPPKHLLRRTAVSSIQYRPIL